MSAAAAVEEGEAEEKDDPELVSFDDRGENRMWRAIVAVAVQCYYLAIK